MQRLIVAACAGLALATSLAAAGQRRESDPSTMNSIAERYVRLVLALGQHDADYVDAYYGPPEWRKVAETAKVPLAEIGTRARALSQALAAVPAPAGELEQLRLRYLERQLASLSARVRMLEGERLSFDEESRALYDAVAPVFPARVRYSSATRRSARTLSSPVRGTTRCSRRPSAAAASGRSST